MSGNAMLSNEKSAKLLGYSGLIPFVVFSLGCWVPLPYVTDAIQVLIAYAAIILSFMGAIHWGAAMVKNIHGSMSHFISSVLPALFAWVALLLAESSALFILLMGFLLLLIYDWRVQVQQAFPAWYLSMRINLTFVVALCLFSALFSLM